MKKILQIVLAISFFAVLLWPSSAKAGTNSPSNITGDQNCSWIADSYITCGNFGFWLDLQNTVSKDGGKLIFRLKSGDPATWQDAFLVFNGQDANGYIVKSLDINLSNITALKKGTSAAIIDNARRGTSRAYHWYHTGDQGGSPNEVATSGAPVPSGIGYYPKIESLTATEVTLDKDGGGTETAKIEASGQYAGSFVWKTADNANRRYFFMCGGKTLAGQKCYDGQAGILKGPISADDKTKLDAAEKSVSVQTACVNSALSFLLCPIKDALTGAIDWTTKLLIDALALTPLNKQQGLQEGFNNFKNIANSLYILIFLVIIFSNFFSMGLDNYSIKKMLPRLFAAVIATQFGFLICSLIVDLSTVLLAALPAAVNTGGKTLGEAMFANYTPGTMHSGALNAASDIGYFIIVFILLIMMVFIILMSLVYIALRDFGLVVLVFISPVAFAAWVLPQTQNLAKKWATMFLKFCMMGPIIGLILALTILVSGIFQKLGETDDFMAFIAPLVPFMGLAIIPKSFKWSGDALSAVGGKVNGYLGGKAKGAVQNSAKQGQIANLKGGAQKLGGRVVPSRLGGNALYTAGMKNQAAVRNAKKENFASASHDELIFLSKTGDKKGDSARTELDKRRRTMAYEVARDAQNGVDPSAGQLKIIRESNETLEEWDVKKNPTNHKFPPITTNLPSSIKRPADPNKKDWRDVAP